MPTATRSHTPRLTLLSLFAAVLALTMGSTSAALASGDAAPAVPMRGINVYLTGYDATRNDQIEGLLDTLAQMHVNTIVLNVPIYIDSVTGSRIEAVPDGSDQHVHGDTPTPAELQAAIRPAVARGFTVWVRPLLDEAPLIAEGAWRGELQPTDPAAFFAAYTRTLLGILAGSSGASWFVIGTEFNSLQQDTYAGDWEPLIDTVRASAAGQSMKLLYALNWDTGGYPQFPSWMDALDGIAVDAYYPLDGLGNDASSAEVATAWQSWTSALQAFRDHFPGKPFFVSEAGIASQQRDPSAYAAPASWPGDGQPADPGLQRTYIEGTCAYLRNAAASDGSRMASGVAWWMTSVNPVEHPEQDTTFAIVGKPAQDAVADCFAAWTA